MIPDFKPKKLLVFDPGESTGWVYIDIKTKTLISSGCFHYPQAPSQITIMGYREFQPHTQVVYETFRARAGSGGVIQNELIPVQVIGMIKRTAAECGCDIAKQEPAQRKRISNAGIVDAGFILPRDDHIRDALRHGIIWLRKYFPAWHQKLIRIEFERLDGK